MTAKTDPDWYLYAGLVFTTFNLSHLIAWRLGTYVHIGFYFLLLLGTVALATGSRRLNVILIAATVTIFFLLVLQHPVSEWDARSIWFYHAKRIFYAQSLYAQLDNYPSWNHNDYPTMVPAIAASVAKSLGYWNEILPRTSVVICCTPALFLAAYLFRSFAFLCLWISALLWVCGGYMLIGYMDSLIATYFAISCVLIAKSYLLLGETNSPEKHIEMRNLWLATSACLLHLLLLKNEGGILSAIVLATLTPSLIKRPSLLWIPGLALAFYVVMWQYPVIQAHIKNDLVSHGGLVARGMARLQSQKDPLLIFNALRLQTDLFHKAFFAMALGVLLHWRRFKCVAPALLAASMYMGVIFMVYLTTYQDLEWHLATSVDRVVLPFNLAVTNLLLYMLYQVWPKRAATREARSSCVNALAAEH